MSSSAHAAAAAFPRLRSGTDALLLRVAPSGGPSIRFGAKVSGRSFDVRKASMDFAYGEGFPHGSAETPHRRAQSGESGIPGGTSGY